MTIQHCMISEYNYNTFKQGHRKALKSGRVRMGGHRGLTGLICMTKPIISIKKEYLGYP